MKNSKNDKIQLITHKTLIIGVDIAKRVQWAQFTDYRGLEVSKHLKFNNDLTGFKSIIQKIEEIKKNKDFSAVIVGMEPTGHYWKPLGAFLENSGIKVVLVNPAHTKKSKELDDNSQTKNDRKDALTLTRIEVSKTQNSTKNRIRALMDEYFPEFETVFKTFIEGKAALHLLKNCPFPQDVLKLKELEIQELLKEIVKKTVGIKKIKELQNVAKTSVGITLGIEGAKVRLKVLLENYEQNVKHLELIENGMEKQLQKTGYLEVLTSIPGVGDSECFELSWRNRQSKKIYKSTTNSKISRL